MASDPSESHGSIQSYARRDVITATVAFVNIPHLKLWSSEIAYRAIVGLHRVIKECFSTEMGRHADVLSALTGAIVVIPDSSNLHIHEYLQNLGLVLTGSGIPVRVGVAHGDIEILSDVDGLMNAIGEPVNIAARIACQRTRPACILHRSYLDFIQATLDRTSFLRGARSVALAGKTHDAHKIRGCRITPQAFPRVERVNESLLPRYADALNTINAVAVGYDLPKFSVGDRSELSKRFRAISDVFDSLRCEQSLGPSSRLYFSPGGDGGIVVLQGTKQAGFVLAERLTRLLHVESAGREKKIQVHTRIGIHYGPVVLYQNAAGVLRPTGRVCFVADAVASDQTPTESPHRAVVITDAFIDAVAEGSRELFAREFEEMRPLSHGPAKGLRRFIRRELGTKKEDDLLFGKLTERRGSWEPIV